MDAVSGRDLFQGRHSLTYDDLIVLPGRIDFAPDDVSLRTRITREIAINSPIIASPMDTVTEADMAIQLALLGGMGFIHSNCSIADQAHQVRRVKRFENGFITDPIVLGPTNVIRDVDRIRETHGFSGIPVTDSGDLSGSLIGIVTNRDIDLERNRDIPLSEVMTRELVTAPEGISLADANRILKESKRGKLPIIDRNGRLVSLVSRTDLIKNRDFPDSSKSNQKQLMVGAAVSTRPEDRERIEAHQTALVRIGKRSKSREAKLIELEILRTQRAEIEAVVSSLDAWDDDADPRAWREMFSELTGLKGEPKWRRLFSLFEPSIEVGLDGAVEIQAALPGRDALSIVLDSDGEPIIGPRPGVQLSR